MTIATYFLTRSQSLRTWLRLQTNTIGVKIGLIIWLLLTLQGAYAQIYTEHQNPAAGKEYDSLILGACSSCYISDAVYVSDTSSVNYAQVYVSSGTGNGAVVRAMLSKMANNGVGGFFLSDNQGGLVSNSLLSNIKLRTYKNGVLQDTASGISALSLGVLTGSIQYVEMYAGSPFNEIEIEFDGFSASTWDINLYRGYANATALPVDLVSFKAYRDIYEHVSLEWETASELNNSHFEILRSIAGSEFKSIGTVGGAGNSSRLLSYAFTDTDENTDAVCYKLRQVDYDQTNTESETTCLQEIRGAAKVGVYPNPSEDGKLSVVIPDETTMEIIVRSSTGQFVLRKVIPVGRTVEFLDLERGMYLISLIEPEKGAVDTHKVIVY